MPELAQFLCFKTKQVFACFFEVEFYFREQLRQINIILCIGL